MAKKTKDDDVKILKIESEIPKLAEQLVKLLYINDLKQVCQALDKSIFARSWNASYALSRNYPLVEELYDELRSRTKEKLLQNAEANLYNDWIKDEEPLEIDITKCEPGSFNDPAPPYNPDVEFKEKLDKLCHDAQRLRAEFNYYRLK